MTPTITDWITALSSLLTATVAVSAAVYAGRQWREARRSREDARDAELERLQPYVAAFLEAEDGRGGTAQLVVQNFGVTAAREVRLTFQEPLRRAMTVGTADEMVALPDLPYLAPGQRWTTVFDSTSGAVGRDLPTRYDGTVRWLGLEGVEHEEAVVLDLASLRARLIAGD